MTRLQAQGFICKPTEFIKRDGRIDKFNSDKIYNGIVRAMIDCQGSNNVDRKLAQDIVDEVVDLLTAHTPKETATVNVDADLVYNTVVNTLANKGLYELLGAYISFKEERDEQRDLNSKLMKEIAKIAEETTRDNANVGNGPSPKMLQAGSAVSRWYNLAHMPKPLARAHTNGDYHIHDLDYYSYTFNCLNIPIKKLLTNGFDAGRGFIRPPQRIGSAAALTAIIIQSSQNDCFGGQANSNFEAALAPFVPKDYRLHLQTLEDVNASEAEKQRSKKRLSEIEDEVYQAMEGLVYNLNSMHSRAGQAA